MDFLKEWILNISLTLIISTILSLLVPVGSIGRTYKVILSLFIFLSFIFPLTEIKDISLPEYEFADYENSERDAYEELTCKQIELVLKKGGYEDYSVNCDLSVKGDEIYIERVCVSLPERYDKSEVKDCIYNSLGIVSEVRYTDG